MATFYIGQIKSWGSLLRRNAFISMLLCTISTLADSVCRCFFTGCNLLSWIQITIFFLFESYRIDLRLLKQSNNKDHYIQICVCYNSNIFSIDVQPLNYVWNFLHLWHLVWCCCSYTLFHLWCLAILCSFDSVSFWFRSLLDWLADEHFTLNIISW